MERQMEGRWNDRWKDRQRKTDRRKDRKKERKERQERNRRKGKMINSGVQVLSFISLFSPDHLSNKGVTVEEAVSLCPVL